ncbi:MULTISPECIES: type II toxin-antitoxin system VapC family toxin [unclassified Bradyrhizobium]|jgi:predicted nucleic acid-binding protein|uniref:type II toxin-antitoxin system VapC family toxin n=1 Tax=unclassified Bradyrhizobium TaxID=2631580 RepID=UPI00143DA9A4|nr:MULTISPECIES: type II toxin-antitoxin system VapC family toxin [unclassified Bradyrhizobium]
MTDQLPGRRIYLDSNAFIYAIEGASESSSQLHSLFEALRRQAEPAYTSEFTLAEVLPKANVIQRRSYLTLILHSGLFDLLPVTRGILIETADYRRNLVRPSFEARGSMPKLPDAIHVVTAIQAGCNTFVSSDRDLKLPVGMVRVGHEDGTLLKLVQDLS